MLVFTAKIEPKDIANYMATVIVPDYLRNLKLEPVQFDPTVVNCDGTQPLRLVYTAPGRYEEFHLEAEHALPLLEDVLPSLVGKKIALLNDAARWSWDSELMRIHFRLDEQDDEAIPSESFPVNEAYVSVSRKELFLSNELFRRYFKWRFETLGLHFPEETPVKWDVSVGGFTCETERLSAQFMFSGEEPLREILVFAQLDGILRNVGAWVSLDCGAAGEPAVRVRPDGIALSLTEN